MASTPPRKRNISNTSGLSPSKYNALVGNDPSRTSPLTLYHLSQASVGVENRPLVDYPRPLHNVQNENVAGNPSRQSKTADLVSSNRSLPSKEIYPLFAESPLHDPFVRHDSNVGRRRAYAISLVNTPARRSHSQEMARLFGKAQETVLFQDEVRKRASESKAAKATIFSPPRRPLDVEPWKTPSKETPKTEPFARTTHIEHPCLPTMSYMGRLSDDLPAHLRIETPAKKSPKKSPSLSGRKIPIKDRVSKLPSPIVKNPRLRPLSPPKQPHTATNSNNTSPTRQTTENNPLAQGEPRTASQVQEWLDAMDHDEAVILQNMTVTPHESPIKANTTAPATHAQGEEAHPSRLSKLMKPVALKFKLPKLPSPEQVPLPLTPTLQPTRFAIRRPRKANSHKTSSSTSSSNSHMKAASLRKTSSSGSASSKERGGWMRLPSVSPEKKDASDVEPLIPLVERVNVQKEEVAPLTPEVEKYRKGEGPRRRRCPSYFDKDILSDSRRGDSA